MCGERNSRQRRNGHTEQASNAHSARRILLSGSVPTTRSTRSAQDGTFSLTDVPAGSYTLQVEAAGFERWTQEIALTGSAGPVTVSLLIGGFAETVAVAAPKLEEELPQELERTGVRVQTITSAQIENGGYYDVAQALQALVPGLYLAPRAGAFDYVTASLQGSRTNEILWLVDGVRISNRLYNGTTPLDTIPAHMIERIEVLEGGQGLFYGTQAVAGAINVVTKAYTDDASGRLQSGFDTNKGGHVNLFARDTQNGHRFVAYGSKDKATGYRPWPAGEIQPSTTDLRRSYDVLTVGGKIRVRLLAGAPVQHHVPAKRRGRSTSCGPRARAPRRRAGSPARSTTASSISSARSWTIPRGRTSTCSSRVTTTSGTRTGSEDPQRHRCPWQRRA